LSEHVKASQDLHPAIAGHDPDPHYTFWEGIDKPAEDRLSETGTEEVHIENGNVFVLANLLFHLRLPPTVWTAAGLVLMAVCCCCFYFFNRPFTSLPLAQLAVFAFCLYMIGDLFSPVYRHQYYEVQWIFPLFIAAATWRRRFLPAYVAVVTGLLLGILHFPFLRMQNTMGEYLILASLLALSLLPERVWPRNPTPTGPPVAA